MKNIEKNALARIITDLIKADNILDVSEMEFLSDIESKYKLSSENLIEAQKMDFYDAVNILKDINNSDMVSILKDMEKLTISDGDCSPKEAYFIIALNFCLNPKYKNSCNLISTSVKNIAISRGNIIYTETEYDEEVNNCIKQNLRYIINDFKIAGLEFVYIPNIIKGFKQMEQTYLERIIRFLAPALSEEEQNKIHDSLITMTTENFCHEFLIRKIGLDLLCESDPSILFQICHTDNKVIYLQIALENDTMQDLCRFVDLYKNLTKNNTHFIPTFKGDNERFKYYGFYRSLFDLLAFPGKNIESRIIIDTYKKHVTFCDLGETLNLPSKQLALYLFIIQQSICTSKKELTLTSESEKVKQKNQKIFDKIYGYISISESSDFTIGITPALAKIKKAISKIRFLDNKSAYIPERKDGTLKIHIKSSKILVRNSDGSITQITESPRWNNL